MSSTNTANGEMAQVERRVMIQLLLEIAPNPSTMTMKDKILRLLSYGLSDSEVAAIVGKKLNYITAVKAQAK